MTLIFIKTFLNNIFKLLHKSWSSHRYGSSHLEGSMSALSIHTQGFALPITARTSPITSRTGQACVKSSEICRKPFMQNEHESSDRLGY